MSKYGTDHRRASRKSEIDNDQSSFLQEKHYSFSKASQLESKQADVSVRRSSQEKEPILDFLVESNDSKATNENLKLQQQQLGGNKGKVFEEIGEEKEAEAETQRDGKEMFKAATSSKVPSERMASFFERSKDIVVSASKIKLDQLWKALQKKALNKRKGQKDEKLEEGGGVIEQEDLLKEKIDKNKSYAKLSQQQDFGNISEIQERKYPRMDDESVQDEEFQSLLNNNNNNGNKILNNNENNSSIPLIDNQSKDENGKTEMDNRYPQNEDKKLDNSKISNNSPQKQEKQQKESSQKNYHHKSVENLGESQYEQNEEQEKSKSSRGAKDLDQKRRLEEANKRKRQLEAELRELEGEIGEIENPQVKKKQKQKQPTRKGQNVDDNEGIRQAQVDQNENENSPDKGNQKDRFAIAEDKNAQESALDLVRRMNLARKEKEQKSQKDRLQFGKIIQEDLRESVEKARQLKEKAMNERKERINSKIEQMRMRSQERRVLNKESNSIIKEIQHDLRISDPTERYKQEVELPELERRKQELAEKRKMYKPIGIEEIRDHAKRHDEEIRLRKLQAKTNILAEYGANLELQSLPKSHALHKVLEQDKQFKMKDVLEMQKKKEQIERRKEYAKLVKEVHVPRVKQKNFDEQQYYGGINEDPENEYSAGYNYPQRQLPPKPKRPVINYPPLKKAKPFSQTPGGNDSSKNLTPNSVISRIQNGSKKQQNHGDSLDRSTEQGFNEAAGMGTSKTSPIQNEFDPRGFQPFEENNSNYENQHNNNFSQPHSGKQAYSTYSSGSRQRPPKSKQFEEQESYRPPMKKNGSDYISMLRKQREATEQKNGKKSKIEDWEKYKYDPSLSQKEKYSYILQSAARLEHNAKLKEMQNHMNPELQEQANDLYIDSIKAKLALLDNLNK